MSTLSPHRHLLSAVIAGLLMFSTVSDVLAQSGSQRSEERRNRGRNQQKQPQQQAEPEERYPNAIRTSPEAKASTRAQSKLQRLFKFYEEQDAAKVLPIAEELINDARTNAYDKSIAARIAGALLIDEDDEKAVEYLGKAMEFDGLNNNDHFESMLILGQLALQADRYDDALAIFDDYFAQTKSARPEDLILKGNALYRLDRFAEAATVLKQAIDAAPEPRNDWLQMLMASYAESDQGDAAIALARQLAERAPDDRRAQLNLAAMYLQNDRDNDAIGVYERLRAEGRLTEDREYKNLAALYLGQEGKETDAIAVLTEGLEKNILSRDYQTYIALAQAYYFSDQIDPAIDNYRLAAPLSDNGEAFLNLAKILANEDRLDEAKEAARQGLDKGLRNPQEAQSILDRRAR